MSNKVLFTALYGSNYQLWVTDGTAAGTYEISRNSGQPGSITAIGNGKALFAGGDGELWITDGTNAGTSEVLNIYPGSRGSDPHYFTPLGNGEVVFAAEKSSTDSGLWVTDGTTAGTKEIIGSQSFNPGDITFLGSGKALFKAYDSTHGEELWVTDGTAAGTSVINIEPDTAFVEGSNPNDITALGNGKAIFSANGPTGGTELWITDGTAGGTSLLQDLAPGQNPLNPAQPASSNPYGITPIGDGKALFSAYRPGIGRELGVTDGTSTGTFLIDLNPDNSKGRVYGSSFPAGFASLGNGKGVFRASPHVNYFNQQPAPERLFVSDGTSTGTTMINVNVELFGGALEYPGVYASLGNGKALFSGRDFTAGGTQAQPTYTSTSGYELWITDGTAAGTHMVVDINPGAGDSKPYDITSLGNGTAMFRANDGVHGAELWITDGTAAGTHMVDDIAAGSGSSFPKEITEIDQSPCYCPGTLILTDRGEVPVEKLAIGDRVVVKSGVTRPIKWIGRRSYHGRFVLGRKDILPICIRAGALGEAVPRRDLWVSPNHAMYFKGDHLEGVLIEAKDLVNGVSIVQVERPDKVEYHHIELDSHDVIIAEGAFSESFIDDDSRAMFHNAHEYYALHPEPLSGPAQYYAPRLDEGYEVEAARRCIALRAGLLDAHSPPTGRLRGFVDEVSEHRIAGWAQNIDRPEVPVCLDILADGRVIGQTLANIHREDLKRAELGSGRHGFVFSWPAGDVSTFETLEVRRSADQTPLGLSNTAKAAAAA